MNIRKLILSTVAAVTIGGAAATAQDLTPYRTVAPWAIVVDHSINGCAMITEYAKQTRIRLGSVPTGTELYLTLENVAWTSLVEGQPYDVTMQFDNRAPWVFHMAGHRMKDDTIALGTLFPREQWATLLALMGKSYSWQISYNGQIILHTQLNNSMAALNALAECHDRVIVGHSPSGGDPFAPMKPVPTTNDPFVRGPRV